MTNGDTIQANVNPGLPRNESTGQGRIPRACPPGNQSGRRQRGISPVDLVRDGGGGPCAPTLNSNNWLKGQQAALSSYCGRNPRERRLYNNG